MNAKDLFEITKVRVVEIAAEKDIARQQYWSNIAANAEPVLERLRAIAHDGYFANCPYSDWWSDYTLWQKELIAAYLRSLGYKAKVGFADSVWISWDFRPWYQRWF